MVCFGFSDSFLKISWDFQTGFFFSIILSSEDFALSSFLFTFGVDHYVLLPKVDLLYLIVFFHSSSLMCSGMYSLTSLRSTFVSQSKSWDSSKFVVSWLVSGLKVHSLSYSTDFCCFLISTHHLYSSPFSKSF